MSDQLIQITGRRIAGFDYLPRATALHNVELPLLYGGVRRRIRSQRAAEALERVGKELSIL